MKDIWGHLSLFLYNLTLSCAWLMAVGIVFLSLVASMSMDGWCSGSRFPMCSDSESDKWTKVDVPIVIACILILMAIYMAPTPLTDQIQLGIRPIQRSLE